MDLIFQVPPQEAARLAKNPNLVVYTPPSARVIWIYLNTQKEPLRDKRVREALYYAIDRDAIVKSIFAGTAKLLRSPARSAASGTPRRTTGTPTTPRRRSSSCGKPANRTEPWSTTRPVATS